MKQKTCFTNDTILAQDALISAPLKEYTSIDTSTVSNENSSITTSNTESTDSDSAPPTNNNASNNMSNEQDNVSVEEVANSRINDDGNNNQLLIVSEKQRPTILSKSLTCESKNYACKTLMTLVLLFFIYLIFDSSTKCVQMTPYIQEGAINNQMSKDAFEKIHIPTFCVDCLKLSLLKSIILFTSVESII